MSVAQWEQQNKVASGKVSLHQRRVSTPYRRKSASNVFCRKITDGEDEIDGDPGSPTRSVVVVVVVVVVVESY